MTSVSVAPSLAPVAAGAAKDASGKRGGVDYSKLGTECLVHIGCTPSITQGC